MIAHRYAFGALVLAVIVWMLFATRAVSGDPAPPTTTDGDVSPVAPPSVVSVDPAHDVELAALKAQVKHEHVRYLAAHRRVRQLTRTLQHSTSTREAIDLACIVYGSCGTLWRRAQCESKLNRYARNKSGASGLFQFLPSTWESTPFGSLSIFSPYANALAAGWMQTHGRGGEWVCR